MQKIRVILLPLAAGLLGTGCSTFTGKKHADLAPFAEYTIALAAELKYGFAEEYEAVYIEKYLSEPTVVAYAEEWIALQELVSAVVAYSLEVTTLSTSLLEEPEQAAALADFLDELVRPLEERARSRLELSESEFDAIVADVRAQKKLLDALGAAQPIVSEIARISDVITDDIQRALGLAAADVEDRIEEEFADEVFVRDELMEWRSRLFRSAALLADHRKGNESALLELLALNPDIESVVGSAPDVTPELTFRIEDRLWEKLERAATLQQKIEPDLDEYRSQRRELREAVRRDTQDLRRAHVTIVVWARAHEKLASGVTDPAQLDMLKLTQKAAKLTPWY